MVAISPKTHEFNARRDASAQADGCAFEARVDAAVIRIEALSSLEFAAMQADYIDEVLTVVEHQAMERLMSGGPR